MPLKPPIVIRSIPEDADLAASPIPPDWILDGSPAARSRHLAFMDGSALTATIWETTAPGRFVWHYGPDELVSILDGEVEITPPGGQPFTLRRGDLVFFPGGQTMIFNVPERLRKLAINPVRTPLWRQLAVRVPLARWVVRRMRAARGA